MLLEIKNLKARTREGKKEILKGVDLEIYSGEIHVIMGLMDQGSRPLPTSSWGIQNMKSQKVRYSSRGNP